MSRILSGKSDDVIYVDKQDKDKNSGVSVEMVLSEMEIDADGTLIGVMPQGVSLQFSLGGGTVY